MHTYSTLLLAYDGPVATVTLNRPDKRNAISYELIGDLLRALAEVESSSAQILIVTGAGKAFCSGMDLDNLRSITGRTPEENHSDSATMALLFRTLYEFPKVTIAAVNGPAIAGGCGVATLCDFTLASSEAKFGYTEVRIGFVPAIVSTFLLRQIGEKQARDLLLTGRIIGAEEAFRLGLVNEIVAPETSSRSDSRAGSHFVAEQPVVAAGDQASAQQYFLRCSRPADCRRGGRERAYPRYSRFSGGRRLVPGEAQPPLDGKVDRLAQRAATRHEGQLRRFCAGTRAITCAGTAACRLLLIQCLSSSIYPLWRLERQ